jgi:hypothetical protein
MRLKIGSLPGSTITVGAELLRVHKNYLPLLAKVPAKCSTDLRTLPAAV